MADETTDPMTDNEALNALVTELEGVISILTQRYDSIAGDSAFVAVSSAAPVNRSAVADAVKAVVTNGGTNPVIVSMDTVIVAVVPPGDSKELPMDGTSTIQVTCSTGLSSQIAIAIFKKTA